MVRFESKLHVLPSLMKVEKKVEIGVGMHARRRCADSRVLDDGQVIQGVSAEGMCCDKLLACSVHVQERGFVLWTEANRRDIVLTAMPIRPGSFILCTEEATTAKDCA